MWMRYLCLAICIIASIPSHSQNDCPYDLNFDGFTTYGEFLFFAADYGSPGNTDYDFNDNGIRDIEDALIFSRYLGIQCPQAEVQEASGNIIGLYIEPVGALEAALADMDLIPAGSITYRLYAEVSNPDVAVTGVWGTEEHPLIVEAPDGLFLSSASASASPFAATLPTAMLAFFPTVGLSSWWTLETEPGEYTSSFTSLPSSDPEFMEDLSTGSIALDVTMGDGWFTWEEPTQMGLPTASNLKLIGQFTTLGQSGICGQLNLEIRTLTEGEDPQFEQAYGLTFSTPGDDAPCATESPCPEGTDLDADGAVTVSDLLMVLGQLGFTTNGPADIDGDGTVTVGDVLALLGAFGTEC